MVLISVTRLRIRSVLFLPGFFYRAFQSNRQVRKAPGNLGYAFLNDANRVFWTCTAWKDEAAMRAFMMSPPHRTAMPKLVHWCDEAVLVHWTQEGPALPNWTEAHRRLLSEGRRSKVSYPSSNQETFRIPLPK